MNYNNIIFSIEGSVAVIKFNRPQALNAINPDMLKDVDAALDEIIKNPVVKVLVFTGEGDKAFVAGADIKHMVNLTPLQAREFGRAGQELLFRIEQLPMPVIACVNGFALGGGCEIAMACDFIYASEKAKFGQPEINLGVIPGFGGTQRLARRVGNSMAKELCMTGNIIKAEEAKGIGLVNRVFPAETLWEETMKVANLIASKGRVALKGIKDCIDRGSDMDLINGCRMESDVFGLIFTSPDQKEGMTAFIEKRTPEFKGSLL
jgi:enoyl-CoA hydratase